MTFQSKGQSKVKVKQSKLFVFASPLSYQYVTIYLSRLLLFFRTTLFIAFRFTPPNLKSNIQTNCESTVPSRSKRLRSIQFQEINIRENSSRILGLYINL